MPSQEHTAFHSCLNRCSDKESWDEVNESKNQLESEYGLHIYAIAYPDGNYSDRKIQYAQKAGYTCGLTVDHGFNDRNTNLFKLKRHGANDDDTIELLAIKASGIWSFLAFIFKKIPERIKYNMFFQAGNA